MRHWELDGYAKRDCGYFTATSTAQASTFPYASTTALTVSGSAYIGSLNGPLQANGGLVSATTSVGYQYGGTGLTAAPFFGQILRGTGSGYSLVATSTLGINTTDLTEGSNLFWTNDRFDSRLSATTTLPNLTTLLGLTNATSTNLTATNSWLGTVRSGLWNGTSIGNQYGGTNIDSSSLTGLAQMVSGVWSASSTLSTVFGGTGWNSLQTNSILTWQRIGQDFHHHRRNGRLCPGFVRRRSHLAGHFHFIQHHRHPSRGQRRHRSDFIRTRLA